MAAGQVEGGLFATTGARRGHRAEPNSSPI